ncbi:MAG: VCBS repeat-containing protein [Thermodesulfobacteriota bacterium]|nr:VCBS repeat-containing protein [Thermodesulfobacteriota bacterium]
MGKKNTFWRISALTLFILLAGMVSISMAADFYRMPFAGAPQAVTIDATAGGMEGGLITIEQADMNNDGTPDIIAGGDTLFAYDIKNNTLLWAIDETTDQMATIINDIAVADITGDGIPDVVTVDRSSSGLSEGLCMWDGSDGTLQWTREVVSSGRSNPDHAELIEILDIDGDEDLDVVTGGLRGGIYQVAAFQADNGDVLWDVPPPTNTAGIMCVEAADLDGDGTPEIVAGNQAGEIVFCGNAAGGTDWDYVTVPDALDVEDIETADFDGDGDLDVVAGSRYHITFYNENGDVIRQFDGPDANPNTWSDLALTDFNQDGTPDVAAVAADREGWIIIDGTDTSVLKSGGMFNSGAVLATGDLDGDGLSELVLGDQSDMTLSVDGATGGWRWLHDNFTDGTSNIINDLTVGDFMDIGFGQTAIVGGHADFVYVLRGKTSTGLWGATGTPTGFAWHGDSCEFSDVAAADLNNDGKDDVILLDEAQTYVAALDGVTGSLLWTYECTGPDHPRILATGDFNGDDSIEIAAFGDGGLYILDGDGHELEATTTGAAYDHFMVADLDGNGTDELIMADRGDKVMAGNLTDGQLFETGFIDFRNGGSPDHYEAGLAFGDIDADDNAELLALGQNAGTYYVYEINPTDGTTTVTTSSITDWTTIALAQIDNDAQMEIILGHDGGLDAFDAVDNAFDWQSTVHAAGHYLIAADLDGDRYDEIAAAGSNNIYLMDQDGSTAWSRDFTGTSGNFFNDESDFLDDMVVADLDGNGTMGIAAAFKFGVNLRMLDAATGAPLAWGVVMDGSGEEPIQLAAGNFSNRPGTEIAAITMVTAGVFGALINDTYDATGDWDITVTGQDSDCDFDITDSTLAIAQDGSTVTVDVADGPLLTGTVSGATYTASGQTSEDDVITTYHVTITLTNADTGTGTVAWTVVNSDKTIYCTGEADFDVARQPADGGDGDTAPVFFGGGGGGGGCFVHSIF